MNNYERMLWHRALWIWCAETGNGKLKWPGWDIIDGNQTKNMCFLCNLSILDCNYGYSTICPRITDGCLNGLYRDCNKNYIRLFDNNSWINRRAFQLSCYRIAFVPIRDINLDQISCISTYMKVLNKLRDIEDYPENIYFVPSDKKDYLRFKSRIRRQIHG